MGASSGERVDMQKVYSIQRSIDNVGRYGVEQSRQYRIQSEDNVKINFILKNQGILGYRINPYNLTRNELDMFYNKLYRELQEYYN